MYEGGKDVDCSCLFGSIFTRTSTSEKLITKQVSRHNTTPPRSWRRITLLEPSCDVNLTHKTDTHYYVPVTRSSPSHSDSHSRGPSPHSPSLPHPDPQSHPYINRRMRRDSSSGTRGHTHGRTHGGRRRGAGFDQRAETLGDSSHFADGHQLPHWTLESVACAMWVKGWSCANLAGWAVRDQLDGIFPGLLLPAYLPA